MTSTLDVTVPISIPRSPAAEPILRLRLGPCRLHLVPGDGPAWVSGTYVDKTGLLPLAIGVDGTTTTISHRFDATSFSAVSAPPQLDLAIDRGAPLALVIETGAGDNAFDLGGIPIVSLEVKAGAGRFDLDFSRPNPAEMRSIELSAGAGQLTARRLANGNFARLHVSAGMAASTIDLSGELTRDGAVRLDAGLASVDVTVPSTTAMRLRTKSFAAGTAVIGPIVRDGADYRTPAAVAGAHPLLTVEASIALGELTIRAI
jgi:hypothetical protein